MALSDLPTVYDLTDPPSNLAGGLAFDVPRFQWGEGVIPAGVAAILASERWGMLGGTIAAVAGYLAPLPVVGVLLAQQASRALETQAGLTGYSLRHNRQRRPRYVKTLRGGRKGKLLKLGHKYVRRGYAPPFMPPTPAWAR
jgi:hypothetical protein